MIKNSLLQSTSFTRLLRNSFLFILFAFCFLQLSAQRIEVHGIKDFSNNTVSNKAWGVGGAVLLDQWVKKTTFGVHFDWAAYIPKNKETNPRYNRLSGGISAFYTLNLIKKLSLQCGAIVHYTNLKHSYIYDYEVNPTDTMTRRARTLQHTGNFIGIGAYISLNYELSPRFGAKINVIPTYLISVRSKSSLPLVAPEYAKGMWLFPLQIGFTYRIFNSKE